MTASRRAPNAPQPEQGLIEGFRASSSAVVSDNLDRLPGAVGLRPFHKSGVMVGTALTVRTRPGDNLAIHEALELLRPGDVLVVDGGGDETRALFGEIMAAIADSRGAAGVVIDGAVRDVGIISQGEFPVFARSAIHKGPYKSGPGEINVAVTIGGMVVEPGDIVLGDEDGVVAFPQAIAADLLGAARAQEERETGILQSIREGRYVGAYGKAAAR